MIINKIVCFCAMILCTMSADLQAMYAKVIKKHDGSLIATAAGSPSVLTMSKDGTYNVAKPEFGAMIHLPMIAQHARKIVNLKAESYWLHNDGEITQSSKLDYDYQIQFVERERKKAQAAYGCVVQ